MFITDRELYYLEYLLKESKIENLFTKSRQEAREIINMARTRLSEVPKSHEPKIRRALDLLDRMIDRYYDSLEKKEGAVYDLVRAYIESAVNPNVDWVKLLNDRREEVFSAIPLLIRYGTVGGSKQIRAVLSPTAVELERFLSGISPENPSIEHVVRKNIKNLEEYITDFLAEVANAATVVLEDRVIFLGDTILSNISRHDASRVAYAIKSFSTLEALRYPWYEKLLEELSKKYGNEIAFSMMLHSVRVTITADITNYLRDRGVSALPTKLVIDMYPRGLYPDKVSEIELSVHPENIESHGSIQLARDVDVNCNSLDTCTSAMSKIIDEVLERASEIARNIAKSYWDLVNNGYKMKEISLTTWGHDSPPSRCTLSVEKAIKEDGDREWRCIIETIYDVDTGNPLSIDATFTTSYRVLKRIVDISDLEQRLKNKIARFYKVDDLSLSAYGEKLYLRAKFKQIDNGDVPVALDSTIKGVVDSIREMREESKQKREQYKLTEKDAVAVLLAYTVDRAIDELFENKAARKMSEVFMKVSSLLMRRGKPLPLSVNLSEQPEAAVEKLLEAGVLRISDNGEFFIENTRLKDCVSWLIQKDIDKELLDTILKSPALLMALSINNPEVVEKHASHDPSVSRKIVLALLSDNDKDRAKIPNDVKEKLIRAIVPSFAIEILERKPIWISDENLFVTTLYVAGKSRESGRLTTVVVNKYPNLLGDVQTVRIGEFDFIETDKYMVLFTGLTEPRTSATKIFEVYDRQTKRGIVVKANNIDEAVAVASREMAKALNEYREIIKQLDVYESKYGVQLELSSKKTEGYMLPEITVMYFEPSGRERQVTIPLQPDMLRNFESTLRKITKKADSVKEQDYVLT